jgi:uncharacterized protein YbcI
MRCLRCSVRGKEGEIEGNDVHPEDAADLREPSHEGEGTLRADISTAIVGLYKKHFGKGPTRCRTYLEPDLVIVVLGGGYTRAEQTMFEAGRWHEVRTARQQWQDTMQGKFISTIEELTGRNVNAFMSADRQDPDIAVEIFVLEQDQAGAT